MNNDNDVTKARKAPRIEAMQAFQLEMQAILLNADNIYVDEEAQEIREKAVDLYLTSLASFAKLSATEITVLNELISNIYTLGCIEGVGGLVQRID